jgi:hypothetical protein
MRSDTSETDQVGFGKALGELLVVAVIAYVFAFGADWGLSKSLGAMGINPKPAATAAPGAPAPAADDD